MQPEYKCAVDAVEVYPVSAHHDQQQGELVLEAQKHVHQAIAQQEADAGYNQQHRAQQPRGEVYREADMCNEDVSI